MSQTRKIREWWRYTADSIWKEFFRYEHDGPGWINWSHITQQVLDTCQRILSERFITQDQQIIRAFYVRPDWGDSIFTVEDYAKENGVSPDVCWIVIRKARRELMIELNIIERERDRRELKT